MKPQTPLLTFKNKSFVMFDGLQTSPVDMKTAATFSRFADVSAKRILDRILVKQYSIEGIEFPSFLDPLQVDGVKWVLSRSRSYLAHAPGAGKTCEAIVSAMLTKGEGQVVFIVSPQLTANWAREVAKFYPLVAPEAVKAWHPIAVIPESNKQQFTGWRAEFLIIPDSMLTKAWVLEKLKGIKKRFVAVDEASRFKDPTAQRTIALFGGKLKDGSTSRGLIQDAHHAVLLDGSPMTSRPIELWAPTYATAPEAIDFMNYTQFGLRYCGAIKDARGGWEFKHSSNEQELKQKLTHSFMHIIGEEKLNHPERRRKMVFMNKDVRSSEQKSWERNHLSDFSLSDIDEEASRGDMAHYRAELGMRKVPWVSAYVKDRLETKGESVLLFAHHRDVVQALADKLSKFNPGIVIGGTLAVHRERMFSEFQAGERKLLILNIAAGGRGHNLQRADRVVFGEWAWTDETNKQCEKRTSRRGNEKLFTPCDYIVCPSSMDEVVLKSVFAGAARVKKVIG